MSEDLVNPLNSLSLADPVDTLTLSPNQLGIYLCETIQQQGHVCQYIIGKNKDGGPQVILLMDNKMYVHTRYITEIRNPLGFLIQKGFSLFKL